MQRQVLEHVRLAWRRLVRWTNVYRLERQQLCVLGVRLGERRTAIDSDVCDVMIAVANLDVRCGDSLQNFNVPKPHLRDDIVCVHLDSVRAQM